MKTAVTAPIALRAKIEQRPVLKQLLLFGAVGGVITIVSIGSYIIPAVWLGVPPLLANVLSFCAAIVTGYYLHGRVSFRGQASARSTARAGRFALVSLVSLALNSLFVWLMTGVLSWSPWWPVLPMVLVTPTVTFVLYRRWVFS